MKLILTEQEGQQLIQIIDAAVRANGLKIASTAVNFMNKIDQAYAFEKAGEKKYEGETRIGSKVQSIKEEAVGT